MNKKLVLTAVVLASVFSVSLASGEPPAGAAPAPVCQSVSEIDIPTSPRAIAIATLQSALNDLVASRVDRDTYCLKFNIFLMQGDGERIAESLTVESSISLYTDVIFSPKSRINKIHLEGLNLRADDTLTSPVLKIMGAGDYSKTVDIERINFSNVKSGLMIGAGVEVKIAESVVSCPNVTAPATRTGTGISLRSKNITIQSSDISGCNIGIQILRGAEGTLIGALTEDDVQADMNRIHANNTGIKWTDGGSAASISTAKFAYNSFFDNSAAISIDDSIIARLGIPDPLVISPVVVEGAAPEDVPDALNCERDAGDVITSRWINVAGLSSTDTVVIYQYDGGELSSVVPQPQNFLAFCEPHSNGRCYFDWDGSSDSDCGDENLFGIALVYDSDEGYTTEASASFRLYKPIILAVGPVIGGDVPTTIPGAGPVATGGGPIASELGGGPGGAGGDSTPEYLGGNDLADKIDENAQGLENSMGGGGASETGGTSAEAAVATSAAGGCGGKSTIAPSSNERLTGILTLLWWLSLPFPIRALARRRMGRR